MTNKNQSHPGYGDFLAPLVDLLAILMEKLFVLLVKGLGLFFEWCASRKKVKIPEVKKITRDDLKIKKTVSTDDAIGYSVTQKKKLLLDDIDRRKHSALIGASGFGKSVLLDILMYDDMRAGLPIIFIDPKGNNESMQQFINLCKLMGRDYQIFSEYYDGSGKISLNPAKLGSPSQIADRIHHAYSWSEEHYENQCYRALLRSIILLKDEKKAISLASILEKLNDISTPKDKEALFERKNIEGIITRLEIMVSTDFGPNLSADGLSFIEAWDQQKCLYIGLPVLGYPMSARALGKMILGDLSYSVYEKYKIINFDTQENVIPVGVFIDEFSAVVIDEFVELVNKVRGAGMQLTVAFQSPSDIQKISPDLLEQILESMANWFVLKQRMEKGANLFSQSIGTLEGTKETVRTDGGEEQSQGSQRHVEELIAHSNIIKNLSPGQCILLRHGPTQVDLVNIQYIKPEDIWDDLEFINELEGINKKEVVSRKEEVAKPKATLG